MVRECTHNKAMYHHLLQAHHQGKCMERLQTDSIISKTHRNMVKQCQHRLKLSKQILGLL